MFEGNVSSESNHREDRPVVDGRDLVKGDWMRPVAVACSEECGGACACVHVAVYGTEVGGGKALCIDSVGLGYGSFGNGVPGMGVTFGECRINGGSGAGVIIKRQLKGLLRGGCEVGLDGDMVPVGDALVKKAEIFKNKTGKAII